MQADTLIVFCCDQNYFPLAKGLVLSILEQRRFLDGIGLAFVDIGCDGTAIEWLLERAVCVRPADRRIMGPLADARFGYQRSQVCRPFLPKLFPEAKTLIWIDCDAWVQDASIFPLLRSSVPTHAEKLFIAPELHYSYTPISENVVERRDEMYSYYEPTFGPRTAAELCCRPTLNSGFFAMAAGNVLWSEWEREIKRLFLQEPHEYQPIVLHMAEQIALNVIAACGSRVVLLDPLYNYVSLWTLPFRDDEGIVRVALPPHLPIGIVHLAGGWKSMGAKYYADRLLYKGGDYLTEADKATLFPECPWTGFR